MGIEQFLNKIIEENLGKGFEEKVEQELDKILAQDADKTDEDIRKELCEDILIQYRTLLELLHIKAPRTVKISADDPATLVINEKVYDLRTHFSHNDLQATECMMAIEALFCDLRSVAEDIDRDIAYIESNLNSTENANGFFF